VESTNFENMQKIEETNQFEEKVHSEKSLKQKKFFHLGPKNNWKKSLNKETINKINSNCFEELKTLKYEI